MLQILGSGDSTVVLPVMETLLSEAYSRAAESLSQAGIPSADHDAKSLLAFVLNQSFGEVSTALALGHSITDEHLQHLDQLVEQRAQRTPLQHLTGKAAFRHLELHVEPGVFIPRPETEVLVQVGIDWLQAHADEFPQPQVVDLCSGSGAIAIAIATEVPAARVHAVEGDPVTIDTLNKNVREHPEAHLTVEQGDAAVAPSHLTGQVHLVISNPPYIPEGEPLEDPETARDPKRALYSGPDGLGLIRAIIPNAAGLLVPCGMLALEHSDTQAKAVGALMREAGFTGITHTQDLTGRIRITSGCTEPARSKSTHPESATGNPT